MSENGANLLVWVREGRMSGETDRENSKSKTDMCLSHTEAEGTAKGPGQARRQNQTREAAFIVSVHCSEA